MDKKEILIKIIELKHNLTTKFKSEENNKFLQILHITTLISTSLLALATLEDISKYYLMCSIILMFISYYCSYLEEIHFMTDNINELTSEINSIRKMVCPDIDNAIINRDNNGIDSFGWIPLLFVKMVCVLLAHIMIVFALAYTCDLSKLLNVSFIDCFIGVAGIVFVIFLFAKHWFYK